MTANETLELISKQWCNLDDLMLLGEFGRNTALKIKKEIKDKLTKQGYIIPKHVIPMKEVVDYLDINISYLESRVKKGVWWYESYWGRRYKHKKDIIIEDIMKSRGLYCLVSNAKVGKSMLALQLSYSLIRGKQFLGRNVLSPSPVLYISTESDFGQLKQRINVLDLKFPKESLFIIDRNGKGEVSIFDFEIDINDFVKKYKGKVVILDMLKDIDLGINYDINSYQDIGQKLLPKLRNLCEKYNITILFTHHLNKQGKTLGSTAFDAVVDGKLTLIEDKMINHWLDLILSIGIFQVQIFI